MSNIILPKMFGQQLRRNHWSTDGLVGYWRFIEAGNLVDESFYHNDGTITGPTWVGNALDFDGDTDYVTIPDSPAFAFPGELTIHVRGRVDVDVDSSFLYQYDAGTGQGYYIQFESVGNIIHGVIFTGGAIICESDVGITLGQTYDMTLTRNATGLCTLYIDAVAQADTENIVGAIDSTDPIYLGVDRALAKDLDGGIEYVWLYNRALSAFEIQQLYINPNLPMQQEPIWMFYSPVGAATPKGPLTHPFYGPFRGPL